MKTLTIVAPFYNEADSADRFSEMARRLADAAREKFSLETSFVLVDDGSADGGAQRFAGSLPGSWKIIRLSRNFGKEVALLAGIDHADGDFVLMMDADLQHSFYTALQLISEITSDPNLDVVHADQLGPRSSWRRDHAANWFYRVINLGQRFDIPAHSGDFRIMRAPVVRALRSVRDQRRFNKGLYAWAGFSQKSIPYKPDNRQAGSTKWSRLSLIGLSVEGITSFSIVPLRAASITGAVIAFAGLLYGLKIVLEVLISGVAVPGFPSLIVAIALIGGLNLILTGMIGEYVWVAVNEAKNRPVYIVREILENEPGSKSSSTTGKREK